jgi:hypothetical protein
MLVTGDAAASPAHDREGKLMRDAGSRSRGQLFRRGLHAGSPFALAAALVLGVAALAALHWFVASGTVTAVVSQQTFLRQWRDDYGYITYRVLALKRDPPSRPVVYVLGGSSTRESVDDARELGRQLARLTGSEPLADVFGSQFQSFAEDIAILDNLPRGRGLFVIGVNANRFADTPQAARSQLEGLPLVIDSPRLDALLDELGRGSRSPRSILVGILDYGATYWRDRWRGLLRGEVAAVSYWYGYRGVQPSHLKRREVEDWLATVAKAFDANLRFNSTLLAAEIRLAREKGYAPVLLRAPENLEAIGDRFDSYRDRTDATCRLLATRHGVPYLTFVDSLGLTSSDFYDLSHLTLTARPRHQQRLASELAPLLADAVGQAAP